MEYKVYPLKLYIRKIPVVSMVGAVSILNLFSLAWLIFQIPHNTEQVFLHYNILFGVDRIGELWEVYLTSLIAIVLCCVDFLCAWLLYRRDWLLSYFLLAVSVVISIFVTISSILVVFLNT